jgi:hypothetical protein
MSAFAVMLMGTVNGIDLSTYTSILKDFTILVQLAGESVLVSEIRKVMNICATLRYVVITLNYEYNSAPLCYNVTIKYKLFGLQIAMRKFCSNLYLKIIIAPHFSIGNYFSFHSPVFTLL